MANFNLSDASKVEQWSDQYALEYLRESAYLPFMSDSETAIFRVRTELTKKAGDLLHFPLIGNLAGAGVEEGTKLYGSEEALPNYSDSVRVKLVRNAVMVTEDEAYKTGIDLLNARKATLRNWSANKLRKDINTALQSIIIKGASADVEDTSKAFADATAAERNGFLARNTDRILVGSVKANTSSGNMATAIGLVDNTAPFKMSAKIIRIAKAMAKKTGTNGKLAITPFRSDATNGREYYVLFVDSNGFRDLSADAEILQANLNARAREGNGMENNPLFQDGDLQFLGVIIKEVPELGTVGTGLNSTPVGMASLCGQSAVAVAWARKPTPRIQEFDYGHEHGVGIMEIRGQKKVSFDGYQYGVVNILHASADDA